MWFSLEPIIEDLIDAGPDGSLYPLPTLEEATDDFVYVKAVQGFPHDEEVAIKGTQSIRHHIEESTFYSGDPRLWDEVIQMTAKDLDEKNMHYDLDDVFYYYRMEQLHLVAAVIAFLDWVKS